MISSIVVHAHLIGVGVAYTINRKNLIGTKVYKDNVWLCVHFDKRYIYIKLIDMVSG